MLRRWNGSGPKFDVEWGGRTWVLKVDDPRPGLRPLGDPAGPLLALEGVAAKGRCAADALSGASLVGVERRFERVEATYAPPGWGDLTVRAAWWPSGDDGIDLEVQVSALSVDQLKALEVRLASILPEPSASSRPKRWVEPRDARSAALSYDGREPDVSRLTTLPPADESNPLVPRVIPGPWGNGWSYIEMVHPHDAARRITEAGTASSLGHTTRYGLFGHDLERGVILRARLRGLWTRSRTPQDEALDRFEHFLDEPPPLGS
ncbi:MAG: hypothetical protein JO329_07345 [Planctomycetaceae bacterium]|nr:hypothetical protein [Planctomycetaceae bacterium]